MRAVRWPGKKEGVILNTHKFEYINMPDTPMKMLGRWDDVEFPSGHRAKRYYVLEVGEPPLGRSNNPFR